MANRQSTTAATWPAWCGGWGHPIGICGAGRKCWVHGGTREFDREQYHTAAEWLHAMEAELRDADIKIAAREKLDAMRYGDDGYGSADEQYREQESDYQANCGGVR